MTWESALSLLFAAVAAVAGLAAVREARATTKELKNIASKLHEEASTQRDTVASMREVVVASTATVETLKAALGEAQAAREAAALLDVRKALALVTAALQRIIQQHQPEHLFTEARQQLRAALAGVAKAATVLPSATSISGALNSSQALDVPIAEREVEEALARIHLMPANPAAESSRRIPGGQR
ncbi:MAG TPA: hypothetical protein VMW11_01895 [Candidatus Dormibacteraeota bacterium]|nr:hypothetical protein [Candidatus Dormibacteraeota bacterium]